MATSSRSSPRRHLPTTSSSQNCTCALWWSVALLYPSSRSREPGCGPQPPARPCACAAGLPRRAACVHPVGAAPDILLEDLAHACAPRGQPRQRRVLTVPGACAPVRCGAAHALPCCHGETSFLEGNLITELPAQIFEKNINLQQLYVPAGLRGRPLARRNFAAPHLPVLRAGAAVRHPWHHGTLHTHRTPARLQLGLSLSRGRHTALAPARVAMRTTRRLSNNRITGMPVGLFCTNTVLTRVTLNDNAMTSLPAGVFGTKGELRSYVGTRLWHTAAPRATIRVAPCSAKHSNACSWTRPCHNKVTECLLMSTNGLRSCALSFIPT